MVDANALRTLLDTMRGLSVALLGTQQFGQHARDLTIIMALGTGPMTADKLAGYAGIPRGTVVRRLAHLAAKGLVTRRAGGVYTLKQDALLRIGATSLSTKPR